jgi:orotate phosphoribosyltransferase
MIETVTLTPEQTLEIFERTGAYLRGHFRLTSGLHSPEFLQCALVLQHPDIAERLGAELAEQLHSIEPGTKIDIVCSPAIGGLIIGHEVARAMGSRFLFTERDPGTREMVLRRGFTVQPGDTAIVVEDVITTGGTTREVIEALQAKGVRVVAAGSIMDRSGGKADLGLPRIALATLNVVTYREDECPMCKEGSAVVKPGSRPA